MKNLSMFCFIIIILSCFLYSSSNVPYETRATWLWPSSINSDSKIKFNLKKILEANLNTVFLEVPKINNNYGNGKEKFFVTFLKRAYRNGLSVHAWFANGRRLGKEKKINLNDETEIKEQIKWISYFLIKYGKYLDGIHLDYIRTNENSPANSHKMSRVTNLVFRIREYMKNNYPAKYLTAATFRSSASFGRPYNTPSKWNQAVPQWFKGWIKNNPNSQFKAIKRGKIRIGVPRFMYVQQDPVLWVKKGLIDAVIPMQYTVVDKIWKDEIDQFSSFIKYIGQNEKSLCMSLGWISDTNNRSVRGYDAPGVIRKIKYGRKNNVYGFAIFILSNRNKDDSPLIKALTIPSKANDFDPPFSKRAISLISRYNLRK